MCRDGGDVLWIGVSTPILELRRRQKARRKWAISRPADERHPDLALSRNPVKQLRCGT